ncbi:MAG: DUF4340 domain-containing protein [Victivallales bacterium]|nr:DUF4340 domain-containing protein [Victivallales bacterium]
MTRKQLILAAFVFAVLLVLSLLVVRREDSAWEMGDFADKKPLLEDLDINKAAKIAVFDGTSRTELSLGEDKWVVFNRDSFPADFAKIRDLMLKLKEMNVAQRPLMRPEAFGSVRLLLPTGVDGEDTTGTVLELYTRDGSELLSLILGDIHYEREASPSPFSRPMPDGRYIMVKGSKVPLLVSDPLTDATADARAWLDKEFIKVAGIKSISRDADEEDEGWEISKDAEHGNYSIKELPADRQPIAQKISQATSALSYIKFTDVMSQKSFEKVPGLSQTASFKVKTFDGFVYSIKILKNPEKSYLSFDVSSDFPKTRAVSDDETPEEKSRRDKEFEEKTATLRARLKKETDLSKWVFEISSLDADKLTIKASDLSEQKKPEDKPQAQDKENTDGN